jgi:hypothetical protein
MMPKRIAILMILGAAGASVVSVAAVNSQPSNTRPTLPGGAPVSAREAATVREPRRGRPTEPAADAVITAHAGLTVAGEPWKIVAYHSKQGALCAGVTWPGEGQEMGCAARSDWFARGPVSVSVGARQASGHPASAWDTIVVSGLADTGRVARVEIVSTDCSSRAVTLDRSGFFLHITPSTSIARRAWPYELLAYDRSGQLVQRERIRPNAPDTDAARAAGVQAPEAGAACA